MVTPSRSVFLLFCAIWIFSGCATTPEAKLKQAYKRANKTPFDQQPALYSQLAREGLITPETRDAWTKNWQAERTRLTAKRLALEKERRKQEEDRRRAWASLTPAQRLEFQMRERELQQREAMMMQQQQAIQWQAEQQRRANFAAALNNMQQNLQRQQEINAYNNRTRVLSQPVNVNVNGNVNHNVNGTFYHYGY